MNDEKNKRYIKITPDKDYHPLEKDLFYPWYIASNHTEYNFGGDTLPSSYSNPLEAFKKFVKDKIEELEQTRGFKPPSKFNFKKDVIYVPFYVYIHGGFDFSIKPYSDSWDSGLGGFIWSPKKLFVDWYSSKTGKEYKRFTKSMKKEFLKRANEIVEDLTAVYNGTLYHVELWEEGEGMVDSVSGFFLSDLKIDKLPDLIEGDFGKYLKGVSEIKVDLSESNLTAGDLTGNKKNWSNVLYVKLNNSPESTIKLL